MQLEAEKLLFDALGACRRIQEFVWGTIESNLPTLVAEIEELLGGGEG